MKKINLLIIFVLFFTSYEILTNSNYIIEAVSFSLNIWKNNVFPTLFPFFVLADLMINYGIPEFLGNLLKPIMNKLFKIKGEAAFVFIMSIISGNPSNAKYTKELYQNNKLNVYEATKILCFSCFSNPLFILGTVSFQFLKCPKVGFLILFCHYIGNLFIGFILRNYHPSKIDGDGVSVFKALDEMQKKRSKKSFGFIFSNSIINSINTLLLILGIITSFLVITTIISNNINLPSVYQSVLNGFIEMTQGLKYVSLENLPLKIKCILCTVILSFGGISIHVQIMSILSDTNIKYFPFLVCRIIHCVISGLLMYFLFNFFF